VQCDVGYCRPTVLVLSLSLLTSVSETIRKPPLVKAQTALKTKKIKYGEKRFSIKRMEFLHRITIITLISPGDCTLQCGMWLWNHMQWIRQVAAPCNVIRGSEMIRHWIRPNVRHIGILHLVSISTISSQSTCHSARVCEILSKSDHPQQKKWRHVDFQDGGSQPSWILEVQ